MNNTFDNIFEIIKLISVSYGAVWFKSYTEKKFEDKNKPSLGDEDVYENIQYILDCIREETNAVSVVVLEGSNGETTLSGFHKKKLSAMAESVKEDKYSTLGEIDNIPVSVFKRNIDALKNASQSIIVSYEFSEFDELAALNQNYGIHTLVACKIITGKGVKKWTSILVLGFTETPKLLTDADLAWINTQAARIGEKISK